MSGERQGAERDALLTLDEASALVGDDIAFWLNNPFMPPDLIAEKVRWWITKAARPIPPGSDEVAR